MKLPMTALCANLKPIVRFKQRDQLLYLHRAYSVLRSNPCRITSGVSGAARNAEETIETRFAASLHAGVRQHGEHPAEFNSIHRIIYGPSNGSGTS